MKLKHLEVFHAVVSAGSATGAAVLLNVSQPAVSNMIRQAELELGFKLFERISGRLYPTPEAATLQQDVQEIFGRIETVSRAVEDIREERAGRLSIAASPTFVNAYIPRAVGRVMARYKNARITIHALPTARAIEESVARREVDIGLVYGPVFETGLIVDPMMTSTVVCAVPQGSRLANLDVLRPDDIRPYTIVATGPSTRIRSAIERACSGSRFAQPTIGIEVTSPQAACLMVAEGVGVGLVDHAAVLQYPLADVLFRTFEPTIRLDLCMIVSRNRPRSKLAIRFAEALRSLLQEDR